MSAPIPAIRRSPLAARPARVVRRAILLVALVALGTPRALLAQEHVVPAILGRWDLRVTGANGQVQPSWLEVSLSGGRMLVGRFVGVVGSARPVARVDFAEDTLRFTIPPQWERDTASLRVEGVLAGDSLTGTLVTPGGARQAWSGRRAPALRRANALKWGRPVALFDGKSLDGWSAAGDNRWRVVGGVLTAGGGGANLVSARTFDDFKLHVEFRYPKGSNSGVYLRGRYEVQIEDSPARPWPLPLDIGAVYGFLPPNEAAARAPGAWQTYDITLVGRRISVVLNGRPVIVEQSIPGITGGAIDSDEGAPGPLLLQGDHGAVEFRRIVLTPAAR